MLTKDQDEQRLHAQRKLDRPGTEMTAFEMYAALPKYYSRDGLHPADTPGDSNYYQRAGSKPGPRRSYSHGDQTIPGSLSLDVMPGQVIDRQGRVVKMRHGA